MPVAVNFSTIAPAIEQRGATETKKQPDDPEPKRLNADGRVSHEWLMWLARKVSADARLDRR